MKQLLLIFSLLLSTSLPAVNVYFSAGTEGDFIAVVDPFTPNATNFPDYIHWHGSSLSGLGFEFNSPVDMSELLTHGARLDFPVNFLLPSKSFSISIYDTSFSNEEVITGFNFSDSSLVSAPLETASVDLTDIIFMNIFTGGVSDDTMDIHIYGIEIIPESSTYALILGGLALGFVVLRRLSYSDFIKN